MVNLPDPSEEQAKSSTYEPKGLIAISLLAMEYAHVMGTNQCKTENDYYKILHKIRSHYNLVSNNKINILYTNADPCCFVCVSQVFFFSSFGLSKTFSFS